MGTVGKPLMHLFPLVAEPTENKLHEHHPWEGDPDASSLKAVHTVAHLDQFSFTENILPKELQLHQAPGQTGSGGAEGQPNEKAAFSPSPSDIVQKAREAFIGEHLTNRP